MIDVKQAVQIAKAKAAEILEKDSSNLEEIERDTYKGRDIWSITLSVPRDIDQIAGFARFSADPLQYKRFLIDTETGELVAIRLRETVSR
jgi:chorismate mutase